VCEWKNVNDEFIKGMTWRLRIFLLHFSIRSTLEGESDQKVSTMKPKKETLPWDTNSQWILIKYFEINQTRAVRGGAFYLKNQGEKKLSQSLKSKSPLITLREPFFSHQIPSLIRLLFNFSLSRDSVDAHHKKRERENF
jgi:hypothetical protein